MRKHTNLLQIVQITPLLHIYLKIVILLTTQYEMLC